HLLANSLQFGEIEQPVGAHPCRKVRDAVAFLPNPSYLVRSTIPLSVAFKVPEVTVHFAFDQAGSGSFACAQDRLAGCLVDREEVVSVDCNSRHVESTRAIGKVVARTRVLA